MNRINCQEINIINEDIPIPQRLYQQGITNPADIEKVLQIVYKCPLTGSLNRLYYQDIICRENVINKGGNYFAMLDIDYFKKVNDTYGHAVGDIVLQKFAEKLEQSTGLSVIRYGGEEFMLVSKDPILLFEKIEKAREEITNLIFIDNNKEFSINFSAGIGTTPQEADKYLYAAKNAGRGQTQISADLESENNLSLFENKINLIPQSSNEFDFNNLENYLSFSCSR